MKTSFIQGKFSLRNNRLRPRKSVKIPNSFGIPTYDVYKKEKKRNGLLVTMNTRRRTRTIARSLTGESLNGAASDRILLAKSAGLIYKSFSVYERRRFHFRIVVHDQGKVSLAYARRVQFPRDVSISAGRRASFRCIQFRGAPFISRPAIHIANARSHYFRSGDGLTPPTQNYRAVYDCCIRSRRKLRLPVAMKKNDLWRNHIAPVSPSLCLKKRSYKWTLHKRFFCRGIGFPEATPDFSVLKERSDSQRDSSRWR